MTKSVFTEEYKLLIRLLVRAREEIAFFIAGLKIVCWKAVPRLTGALKDNSLKISRSRERHPLSVAHFKNTVLQPLNLFIFSS